MSCIHNTVAIHEEDKVVVSLTRLGPLMGKKYVSSACTMVTLKTRTILWLLSKVVVQVIKLTTKLYSLGDLGNHCCRLVVEELSRRD